MTDSCKIYDIASKVSKRHRNRCERLANDMIKDLYAEFQKEKIPSYETLGNGAQDTKEWLSAMMLLETLDRLDYHITFASHLTPLRNKELRRMCPKK